ncbi:L-lactate dehydrogenase complex protein LldE [Pontibacter ummariensis]|uniref:L-lactate dehydrogenase complex protein LldE n=1 Tax=Pontibacter ummariensis TaxID=1610492 RepID=A0A239LW28_9BACT|nr:(Fe-S)-binding protein [Pontibacter ummariensis]PRY01202.1 L-lactate dehydrogenase complex protein LldE [Pontibacter ummariensis]SNT33824.1 L-lactate dehydrogenase complex protein LldE [Pontibacter ummariensis]
MTVSLFIPCYVDQFYPNAAIATLELLEKLGVKVVYPSRQTCCGQPMANSGFEHLTMESNNQFIENFREFDYIVAPSGSCVLHMKDHLHSGKYPNESESVRQKVYELTEFLTDVLKVNSLKARFPHKVGLHQSCHGQRGLKLASMSELVAPAFSKPEQLLSMVEGLELIELTRKDECCGFGGTFCVAEEAVSVKMGKDRVMDHLQHDAEVITGSDMSCLMHMEGILRRKKSNVRVMHIAEILNAQEL